MIENSADKRALTADGEEVPHKDDEVCSHLFFTTRAAAAFHSLKSKREMDKKMQFASELSIVLVCRGQKLTEDKKCGYL